MAMLFRPKPIPKKYAELYERIRDKTIRLDNLCNVYRGIWTGVLHIFVVTDQEIEKYDIEKEALRPLLRGKDVFPFRYKWVNRWIIYATGSEFKDKYPNAMRYLSSFKTILERRGAVWVYKRSWWELEEPLSPKMFEIEKILSPYISRFNSFAYEEGKYYVLDSTSIVRFWFDEKELLEYVIKWKELNESDLDIEKFVETYHEIKRDLPFDTYGLHYLLGLLNSDVIEFFYKLYAPRLTKRGSRKPKGKYYLYIPPNLNILPIKIGEKEEIKQIVKQVKIIMKIAAKLNEINEDVEEYALLKESIEEEISLKVAELNELVYDIYNLSETDRSLLQSYVLRKR